MERGLLDEKTRRSRRSEGEKTRRLEETTRRSKRSEEERPRRTEEERTISQASWDMNVADGPYSRPYQPAEQ